MQRIRVTDTDFEELTPAIAEATALLLEESDHKYEDYSATDADIRAYADTGSSNGHRLYMATDETQTLIGAADVLHGSRPSTTAVYNLAVQEAARGNGVGSLLVKQIAVHADMHGSEKIYLVSLADEFFQSLGFVAVHDHIMVAAPMDVLRA